MFANYVANIIRGIKRHRSKGRDLADVFEYIAGQLYLYAENTPGVEIEGMVVHVKDPLLKLADKIRDAEDPGELRQACCEAYDILQYVVEEYPTEEEEEEWEPRPWYETTDAGEFGDHGRGPYADTEDLYPYADEEEEEEEWEPRSWYETTDVDEFHDYGRSPYADVDYDADVYDETRYSWDEYLPIIMEALRDVCPDRDEEI